jgi:UDP-glucose 4-epimerase
VRVLVTGGAGFIGSRLVGRLLEGGDQVHAVDDLSLGARENLASYSNSAGFSFTEMDCCSADFSALVGQVRADRIFHLAANSDISKGTSSPETDLNRTFLTTYHVLEAMRRSHGTELVFASTSAIYGEAPGQVDESHGPLVPISLYGSAKLAAEAYVSAYSHLFSIRSWIFRFPNVVGPNLTHGAIFDLVRRIAENPRSLRVLGNGTQTKPYLDVDDLIDAILLGVRTDARPMATFNVAGEGATTVREMAEMIRKEMSPDAELLFGTEDRGWAGDVPRFEYDTRKIRALGWKPRYSSNQAVERAVAFEAKRCRRSS